MEPKTIRLTREELYEQVWSEPMQKLAAKYGISDVGLAKTCRRLRIPVPGRGYWAKKQFGKAVRRIPLPRLPLGSSGESASFAPPEPRSVSADGEPIGAVAKQERFEALAENRIVVADTLSDPHPLVAHSVAALRRAKPNPQGYLVPTRAALNVRVSLDGADRAMCILDALLKAIESRGFTPSLRPGKQEDAPTLTIVRVGEEDVPIALSERIDVVEQPQPTPAPEPNRRRTAAPWRSWGAPRTPAPKRELVASGQFTLRIDESYLGIQVSWSDGKRQRVDQSLNAFVVGLVTASEKLRERRIAFEEREREWKAAEDRRAQEERRRAEEAGRVRALESVLTDWRDARDVRQYVAEARAALDQLGDTEPNAPITWWLEWCETYAQRVDPINPKPIVPKDPGPPRPSSYGWR